MEIALGSTNPAKRRAVERATDRFDPTIVPVSVDSGVSEQPTSIEETVTGARTRARRALEATDQTSETADTMYGVGLEGGVARLESAPGVRLIMWAAVTDGTRTEVASGPTVRLPESIGERVEGGAELGPLLEELVGKSDVANAGGAIGVFTGDVVTRVDALSQAVACSFGPFVISHYDDS